MGDTIGRSVRSILNQVDDRFEVLVVDDGSTDQSVAVLQELASKEPRLRLLELPSCRNRKLGVTRNISVHAADGEFVLLHLDADDVFDGGLSTVVNMFERLNMHIPHDFYFMSCGFGIASREFLLEYGPYRNLPVGGEDQDLWRRLFADDAIIWLESEPLDEEIGYEKDRLALARRWFKVAVSNFQTGISYRSYLSWSYSHRTTLGFLYDLFLCAPLSYLIAAQRQSYQLPAEFKKKGQVDQRITEEMVNKWEFEIDRAALSDRTKQLYNLD
jgi:glycosyltransferase involved in cell wall biosynthesis